MSIAPRTEEDTVTDALAALLALLADADKDRDEEKNPRRADQSATYWHRVGVAEGLALAINLLSPEAVETTRR